MLKVTSAWRFPVSGRRDWDTLYHRSARKRNDCRQMNSLKVSHFDLRQNADAFRSENSPG